ncbi:MAG TPA: tRNA preQ1(34) S-adenosylmethionine ribosyltransferase-isomerase QueA [Candidatus Saccharimonadales bacterium]|nr:tRNA preQ1(34) S-adenosylmethionine ribosyltransferase-isomerase QueA [Candidatus Saccharimonadales bacterium]
MRVSDFTYSLPEKLIAQHPPKRRGNSRLLVVERSSGTIQHKHYDDFVDFVQPGDVVVFNDTKVIKARLLATNRSGQPRELLLLEDHHNTDFTHRKALYRGKLHEGEQLTVRGVKVTVDTIVGGGIAEISSSISLLDLAEQAGMVPLPPYMKRTATGQDVERYQTVFAREPGSVAAPTASLNFTDGLQNKLIAKGVKLVYLTLHVGLGTFLPIRADLVEKHRMHSEYFEIPPATIQAIQSAKQSGKRIFAVGTTVARTLEYAHSHFPPLKKDGPFTEKKNVNLHSLSGEADIFIYPGYEFKVVDGLLTNFHAPGTTVLMLAAAFAGWDNLKVAYREAIKENYAFLSYGDSMLII